MYRVAVIIATFQRPDELQLVIEALKTSTLSPAEVVIADSSDEQYARQNREVLASTKSETLKIRHIQIEQKSLTVQKNAALNALNLEEFDFVQILDDDTIPDSEYLMKLAQFLASNDQAVGASGTTKSITAVTSLKQRIRSLPFRLVGLDSTKYGSVTKAGIGIGPSPIWDGPHEVEWLFGCSMWKSRIFGSMNYEPRMLGSCLFEDVEFSVRVRRLGALYVIPSAYLNHLLSNVNRPDDTLHSYRFSRNRLFVTRAQGKFSNYVAYLGSALVLSLHFALRATLPLELNKKQLLSCSRSTLLGLLDAMRNREPK